MAAPLRRAAALAGNCGFVLALCVLTPLFSFGALLVWCLPQAARYHFIGQWNRSVLFAARWLCGIRHEVKGRENLPEPPYVICSKHQSTWETIAYYLIFPRSAFVTKRALLWIPFFGWGFKICMDPIAIDRSQKVSALRSVLEQGKERIGRGICVVIYPEGTRTPVGRTRPFLPSAFALAVACGVPVVPVAHNSGTRWPGRHFGFSKRAGTITVSVGPAISAAGRRAREVCAEAEGWINAETRRIGG